MGGILPASDDDRTCAAIDGRAYVAARLRGYGALAGLVGHLPHWVRRRHADAARQTNSHSFLADVLQPLDSNANSLATKLLDRFGSLSGIVQASEEELAAAGGSEALWVNSLVAVRSLLRAAQAEIVIRTRLAPNDPSLRAYITDTIGNLKIEKMLVFMADASRHIVDFEALGAGSAAAVMINPRLLFARALAVDCRFLLLAHNHPSGNPEPSPRDIHETHKLKKQASDLGIAIVDHLIVSGDQTVSLAQRSLL